MVRRVGPPVSGHPGSRGLFVDVFRCKPNFSLGSFFCFGISLIVRLFPDLPSLLRSIVFVGEAYPPHPQFRGGMKCLPRACKIACNFDPTSEIFQHVDFVAKDWN